MRAIATIARIVLGGLWIHEGLVKYHAGFGKADILLVVQSAQQNGRVPGFFRFFTEHVLARAPGLFGFGIPLLETGIGIVLVLGVFTLPVALISVGQLCTYWLADQLIAQYPIMIALSAAVAVFAAEASHWNVTRVRPPARRIPAR